MQYYKGKVRLAGNTMNEVVKVMSAPELLVLQYIHGVDAIIEVKPVKTENISVREEKDRLKGLYDKSLGKRKQSIDKIFGPLGAVPTTLPDDLLQRFDIVDEDDVISVAKNVTKKDKNVGNRSEVQNGPRNQTEANNLERTVPAEEISLDEIAG